MVDEFSDVDDREDVDDVIHKGESFWGDIETFITPKDCCDCRHNAECMYDGKCRYED